MNGGGFTVSDIVQLAEHKLCGSYNFQPAEVDHLLAILGQRFGLDISSSHPNAVKHVEAGVASHMRICRATTGDRKWSFTMYPSEPFLSCIAASLLHQSPETLKDCLQTLARKVFDGMISTGQAGELASRLLWLLAKDILVRAEDKNLQVSPQLARGWDAELTDCKMVPLFTYLEFLFGRQSWPAKALETLKGAHVNFSHWVEMDAPISTDDNENPIWVR